VFLSGTASIDASGDIVHEGDVVKQLGRTMENIEALLANAGANAGDLVSLLVYLRDPADGEVIGQALHERLGGVPFVLLHAPVCRPGWLVEIEGVAIVSAQRPDLPAF
jgi:enamine deaminase RidA (YjgF/YER057c/UK114 family)